MRLLAFASLVAVGCGSPSSVMDVPDAKGRDVSDGGSSDVRVGAVADAARKEDAAGSVEGDDEGGVIGPTPIGVDAAAPSATRVLDEAEAILADVSHSTYTHETLIDETTGTYDVDCSGFVNFVLQQAVSADFAELQQATETRPVASSYVGFIASLPTASATGWHRVSVPSNLVPGDIVSWDEPAVLDSTDTGHVMIVAAPPVHASHEFDVTVIDSTSTGHGSSDARTTMGTTGVGSGVVAITIDASGAPTGYRWSTEPGSPAYTTKVSLGHLK